MRSIEYGALEVAAVDDGGTDVIATLIALGLRNIAAIEDHLRSLLLR